MLLVSIMHRDGNGDVLNAECCADHVVRRAGSCLVDHDRWRDRFRRRPPRNRSSGGNNDGIVPLRTLGEREGVGAVVHATKFGYSAHSVVGGTVSCVQRKAIRLRLRTHDAGREPAATRARRSDGDAGSKEHDRQNGPKHINLQ